MYRRFLCCALLGAVLCTSLPAAAASGETAVYPPCNTTLYYSAGTVELHLDSRFSYSTVEVYRSLQEGKFLYYDYNVGATDAACLYFPLIEGDYFILLTVPAETETQHRTFSFSCTIGDPDMDASQSFDSSCHRITLSCDASSESDLTASRDHGVIDRIYTTSTEFIMGGRGFTLGDLNHDDATDATDASLLLTDAALVGSGSESALSFLQQKEADASLDGNFDAIDASVILSYSAQYASGEFSGDMMEYALRQ